jgi:hypothetical protein
MTPNTELSDEQINEQAMRCCGVLHGDVLHMDRGQRIAFARRVLAASPAPLREADEGRMKLERVKIGELILPGISGEEYDEPEVLIPSTKVLEQLQERLVRNGKDRVLDLFVNVAPSGIEADGDGGKGQVFAAFELAMKQAWQMVDPLRPPPAGSYYMGEHNGIIAALRTVRENFNRALSPTSPPNGKTEGDADGVEPSAQLKENDRG